MRLTSANFLTHIKSLVTGGGRGSDNMPKHDAGYLRDMNFSINDLVPPLTDSSGGTASQTIALNAFKQTVSINLDSMALIVDAQNFKVPMPFAFTLTGTPNFRADVAITTGGKATTLTTNINTTPTTGGIITVSGAYATGVAQAASAAFSALNTGSAGDFINVITSSTTTFTQGYGHVEFTVINNDLANAAASILARMNAVASETNLKVYQAAASLTAVGTLNVVIPRDYDEATDVFTLHIGVASAGSTDTPGLAAAAYRKRAGSNIATVDTAVTAKTVGGTTAAALSSAMKNLVFSFAGKGLKRDDAITLVLTSDAHTTDAILVYYIKPVYRSTLVSYYETDGTTNATGNFLR